jgi:hypothetical protein
VAGLLPSVRELLSLITLEDEHGNKRSFALHHHATDGYFVEAARGAAPFDLSLTGPVVPYQIPRVVEVEHGLIMTLAIRRATEMRRSI